MEKNQYKDFYDFLSIFEVENGDREKMVEYLLPSGSGINCKWEIEDKPNFWNCRNSFQVYNENGFADGYIDFTVRIYKNPNREFRVFINGVKSHAKNRKYLINRYIEDTVHYYLAELTVMKWDKKYKDRYIEYINKHYNNKKDGE